MTFTVTEADAGGRLDRFLAARIPTVSRMRLRRELDAGAIRVNGVAQAPGWRLTAGDAVEIDLPLDAPSAMTPEPIPLTILYEDAEICVVEKPAGMVVHPAGRHTGGTLANALAHHFNVAGRESSDARPPIRPGIVHRLDRATSGVMVIAKTQEALSKLTVAFQNKRVVKRYLALVHGRIEADEGEWSAPIGSDPSAVPKWGIRPEGRPALTRFHVRERLAAYTLLELEPVTGRTNQLRLHAAHFGHPIVGDALFGRGEEPDLGRLFLHAYRLEFAHPRTGEWRVFESPLPPALDEYLIRVRSPGHRAHAGLQNIVR